MVVEVEEKILQGFAKHPEQEEVEEEREREAASSCSKGAASPPLASPLYRGVGRRPRAAPNPI